MGITEKLLHLQSDRDYYLDRIKQILYELEFGNHSRPDQISLRGKLSHDKGCLRRVNCELGQVTTKIIQAKYGRTTGFDPIRNI